MEIHEKSVSLFNRLNKIFIFTKIDFMNNPTYTGLIECGWPDKSFIQQAASLPEAFDIKKAFVFHESARTALQQRFPNLEWATDCNAILEDENIGLVLISSPAASQRHLISDALKAKKHVQVV